MTNERQKEFFTESKHEALLFLAERNPRKRAREVVGVSQEGACIILNVVLPGSYIRPHKHENSQIPDTLRVLEGVFKLFIFDDEGVVTDTTLVSKKKEVKMPTNTWHTIVALAPCAFSESKREFGKKEIFPSWAPKEETPEGETYLEELREREAVDKKESQG